jgi:peptide deformylase
MSIYSMNIFFKKCLIGQVDHLTNTLFNEYLNQQTTYQKTTEYV